MTTCRDCRGVGALTDSGFVCWSARPNDGVHDDTIASMTRRHRKAFWLRVLGFDPEEEQILRRDRMVLTMEVKLDIPCADHAARTRKGMGLRGFFSGPTEPVVIRRARTAGWSVRPLGRSVCPECRARILSKPRARRVVIQERSDAAAWAL